eukprot:776114-Rhodomonas_salina.3
MIRMQLIRLPANLVLLLFLSEMLSQTCSFSVNFGRFSLQPGASPSTATFCHQLRLPLSRKRVRSLAGFGTLRAARGRVEKELASSSKDGDAAAVGSCLSAGADPNGSDEWGSTCLHLVSCPIWLCRQYAVPSTDSEYGVIRQRRVDMRRLSRCLPICEVCNDLVLTQSIREGITRQWSKRSPCISLRSPLLSICMFAMRYLELMQWMLSPDDETSPLHAAAFAGHAVSLLSDGSTILIDVKLTSLTAGAGCRRSPFAAQRRRATER